MPILLFNSALVEYPATPGKTERIIVEQQREYFLSGTLSTSWRKAQLEALKAIFSESSQLV